MKYVRHTAILTACYFVGTVTALRYAITQLSQFNTSSIDALELRIRTPPDSFSKEQRTRK